MFGIHVVNCIRIHESSFCIWISLFPQNPVEPASIILKFINKYGSQLLHKICTQVNLLDILLVYPGRSVQFFTSVSSCLLIF